MRFRRWAAAVTAVLAGVTVILVPALPANAAPVLPAGFVLTESATGLAAGDLLTDFAYLPDGSVLSIGKRGKVAWASADRNVTRVIATITVVSSQDLGLVGLAVAPDFQTSRHIYTAAAHPVVGGHVVRVTEWTVVLDPDPVGVTAPRTVLEAAGRQMVHAMTGVVAADDGTLWVSIGDMSDWTRVDPDAQRALDLDQPEGKLLHVLPDGRGAADNPFYDAAAPSSWRSRVYAMGFRSPFRFSLDPRSGAPILGDVGWNAYEEVNLVRPGASYGWPCWEGNSPTVGYADQPFCAGVGYTPPLWTYGRAGGGSSITGGVFYTGDRYPQAYRGAYFFGDYTGLRIWTMQFDASGQITRAPEPDGFATSAGRPVKFASGPNGDVVFADIGTGKLNRLSYTPGNRAPVAVATTTTDPATRTVTFDGGRSYDLDGDPLTYSWSFGDGTTGSGVSVTHTYAAEIETATARLTVSDPASATGTQDVAVAPGNYQPQLSLTGPAPGQTFAVGDTATATATATDAEDGPLTVHWATTLVHCRDTVCHNHPGQTSTGPSYAEQFTNHEDDTYMEVTASATDSHGVTTSQTFEALPRLRTLTLNSTVPATMTIGSAQRNVALVIANATTSFAAATTASDGVATFERWSDGGEQQRTTFTMPDADVTLTATYLTPIDRRFNSDAALRALIGPAIGGEQGSATLRWRDHANLARLYWTPGTSVHEVHGAILGDFVSNGGHVAFGAPTTDETITPDGIGRFNHFTGTSGTGAASVYWTPSTGAHMVSGAIRVVWAATGWEGFLGYPLTDETVTPDGVGRFNHFSNGGSIYWSPSTGAHEVLGAIRVVWAATGWEGFLGYPLTGETGTPDGIGRFNHFSNSGSIYWSPSTGAHEVHGAIRVVWAATGWEGFLGYPLTDETVTPDGVGRFNHFSNGGSIYWSPSTGAHEVHGGIRVVWAATGWEGFLGYPLTDETVTPDGVGRFNHFSNGGSIYWSPSTGAHEVRGAIRQRWSALGWEQSYLGYPTSGEFSIPGGRRSNFQHGYITWNSATGQVVDRAY